MSASKLGADTLRVAETFGPTIQGEGRRTGVPAWFIRLYGCNRDCSWCDTAFTWDTEGKNGIVYPRTENEQQRTVREVVEEISPVAEVIVITGGEPMLQASRLVLLLQYMRLVKIWRPVEIETNGTRPPLHAPGLGEISYNVSPKLPSAGVSRPASIEEHAAIANAYGDLGGSILKYVCSTIEDLEYIDQIVAAADRPADLPLPIWIMPEGRDLATITETSRRLVLDVIARGWTLGTRHHVALWGDERKR